MWSFLSLQLPAFSRKGAQPSALNMTNMTKWVNQNLNESLQTKPANKDGGQSLVLRLISKHQEYLEQRQRAAEVAAS